jgi:hypothetical protein
MSRSAADASATSGFGRSSRRRPVAPSAAKQASGLVHLMRDRRSQLAEYRNSGGAGELGLKLLEFLLVPIEFRDVPKAVNEVAKSVAEGIAPRGIEEDVDDASVEGRDLGFLPEGRLTAKTGEDAAPEGIRAHPHTSNPVADSNSSASRAPNISTARWFTI